MMKNPKLRLLSLIILFVGPHTLLVNAQEVIPLYPEIIPNAKAVESTETPATDNGLIRQVLTPTLELFLPKSETATGTAVIICAGGGYGVIVYDGEGVSNAKRLAERGIAAFVLKYRLPNDATMENKTIGPLQDAQQAIKFVRENAAKWSIDPAKIGIMGFSAGGHLAATAATHFKESYIDNPTNTSLRPDFQILVYPVISMTDELTHMGSRDNLLGKNPSQEIIKSFSNELQVDSTTPPAYLTHAGDDKLVDVDNSILYFEALRHNQVAAELHIYQKGDHGFIFRHPDWTDPLFSWMMNSGWLSPLNTINNSN